MTLGVKPPNLFSFTVMLERATALLISLEYFFKSFPSESLLAQRSDNPPGGFGKGAVDTFPEEQQKPSDSFLNLKAPQC